jgi:hypothetical protein
VESKNKCGAYRWGPRREDQHIFNQLFVYARNHADAAGHPNHPDPLAPVWMAIALEQDRRITELEARIDDPSDE